MCIIPPYFYKSVRLDMEQFVEKTFRLFSESVENGTAICALKNMCHLSSQNMMTWSDKRIGMLYTLRYGYALAWEYRNMIENILRHYADNIQSAERDHKAITMQCVSEHRDLLETALNHMRKENRVPGICDCVIRGNSESESVTDIKFCSWEFSWDVLSNRKHTDMAFIGHSFTSVNEMARMAGCDQVIYQSKEFEKRIPWAYPENIKEYLWHLNEHCINYKNGHNCFGVCARQLDIMPTLTTGKIFSQVYYNRDREDV